MSSRELLHTAVRSPLLPLLWVFFALTTVLKPVTSLPKHMVSSLSAQDSALHTPARRCPSRPSARLVFLAGFIEILVCTPPLTTFAMTWHAAAANVRYTPVISSAVSRALFAASPSLFLWPCPSSPCVARDVPSHTDCWWQTSVLQQNHRHAPTTFLLTNTSPVSFFLNEAATDTTWMGYQACRRSSCLPVDGYESCGHEPSARSAGAVAALVRQNPFGRSGRGNTFATILALSALGFCLSIRAPICSLGRSTYLDSAGHSIRAARRLVSVAPEAGVSCAKDLPWHRRRFAGALRRHPGTVEHEVSRSKFRNASALPSTLQVLHIAEKHLNAMDRVKKDARARSYCLCATLAPVVSGQVSCDADGVEEMDNTTTQARQNTVGDVSHHAALAKGRRPYRVIALFRAGMPLEKVRENVATYVLQLRKWRSARLKAVYRGHRRLAYLIKGQETAHVVELTFEVYPSAVRFLHMKLDFDPSVLRFMILRNPPLPRSIIKRQHLIPPEEFGELVKYTGTHTT